MDVVTGTDGASATALTTIWCVPALVAVTPPVSVVVTATLMLKSVSECSGGVTRKLLSVARISAALAAGDGGDAGDRVDGCSAADGPGERCAGRDARQRHSADAFGAVGIDQRVEDVRAERDGGVFVAGGARAGHDRGRIGDGVDDDVVAGTWWSL